MLVWSRPVVIDDSSAMAVKLVWQTIQHDRVLRGRVSKRKNVSHGENKRDSQPVRESDRQSVSQSFRGGGR